MENAAARNGSIRLPTLAIVVWAAVLLIAFFSYRGADVGRIAEFAGGIRGPFFGFEGLKDSVVGGLSAVFIAFSWFGAGSVLLSFFRKRRSENHSHLLELAMKTAAGAAIWSLIWFFLGLAGLYDPRAAAFSVLAGLACGVYTFKRVREVREESRVPEGFSGLDRVLLALVAVPVVLAAIAALAPPTAKDTLLYHFAVPKAFIAQGSSAFIDGNIASYLALGTEMHAVWAMLVGGMVSERAGEAAAGAINFAFFPLLLLAIFGWAREIGVSRRWSLIALLMAATVPTVYHVAASGYIDLSLALYVTLAIYSLGRWWRSLEKGWLILIGLFLGAALSVKLTTLFVMAAFALIVLLRTRQSKDGGNSGSILLAGFGALVLAAVIASPWYLRTWKETGSPVFPFYMSFWPGDAGGWDVERSNLFQAMNSQYGGARKSTLDYIAAPWNLSVAAQPEIPAYFDGVLGVAFLLGLPLVVWALWKFEMPVEIKAALGVAAVVFLFWLFSSQQLRYLLPILPVLAIGIALAARRVTAGSDGPGKFAQASLAVAAAAAITVSAAWFLQKNPIGVVFGGETRDEYLARNLDHYEYYRILNTETPADSKVWLINMRRDTYHLDRPYFSDYLFEDWTLRKMIWESRSSAELKAKAAAMGIQYVLARHDFMFDYDRSTIPDDTKPRAVNEEKLRLAKEFILDRDRTVRADGKFSLIKVF